MSFIHALAYRCMYTHFYKCAYALIYFIKYENMYLLCLLVYKMKFVRLCSIKFTERSINALYVNGYNFTSMINKKIK